MTQQKTTGEEISRRLTPSETTTVTIGYEVLNEIRIRAAELSSDAGRRDSSNDYLRRESLEVNNEQ